MPLFPYSPSFPPWPSATCQTALLFILSYLIHSIYLLPTNISENLVRPLALLVCVPCQSQSLGLLMSSTWVIKLPSHLASEKVIIITVKFIHKLNNQPDADDEYTATSSLTTPGRGNAFWFSSTDSRVTISFLLSTPWGNFWRGCWKYGFSISNHLRCQTASFFSPSSSTCFSSIYRHCLSQAHW